MELSNASQGVTSYDGVLVSTQWGSGVVRRRRNRRRIFRISLGKLFNLGELICRSRLCGEDHAGNSSKGNRNGRNFLYFARFLRGCRRECLVGGSIGSTGHVRTPLPIKRFAQSLPQLEG